MKLELEMTEFESRVRESENLVKSRVLALKSELVIVPSRILVLVIHPVQTRLVGVKVDILAESKT